MRAFLKKDNLIKVKNETIMQSVAITGTARTVLGKKAVKATRAKGLIPCNIYGGEKNIHFSAHVNDFKSLIYTPDFKLAEITIDGSTHNVIVKEIQSHPVTDAIMHIDFVELIPNKTVKAEIPLRLVGQSVGAKTGGAVMQKMRHAKVKTTPESLVDALEVDITELELGDSARIRDIKPVDGVTVLNEPSSPVVSIEVPRALRSLKADEEKEAADAADAATAAATATAAAE